MKKPPKWQWVLFALSLSLFAFFRLHLGSSQKAIVPLERSKPSIPEAAVSIINPLALLPLARASEEARMCFPELLDHPWVQMQPCVSEISIEMVRDFEALEEFCRFAKEKRGIDKGELQNFMIETLIALNEKVPFSFPKHLYNVLCITDSPAKPSPPVPFQVFKRLYLGENPMHMPFYLDVRVFQLTGRSSDEVIAWHMARLEEGEKAFSLISTKQDGLRLFLGKGLLSREGGSHVLTEAFAERGVYLECLEKEGCLFVAYAEAPLKVFQAQETFFDQRILELNRPPKD